MTVGICYDLSFTGVDGLYPLFFLLFGYAAGKLCQRLLTRNYISMLILRRLSVCCSVCCGISSR